MQWVIGLVLVIVVIWFISAAKLPPVSLPTLTTDNVIWLLVGLFAGMVTGIVLQKK